MSYVNILSKKEAEFLFEAVKSYQTELQASIDFKKDCINSLDRDSADPADTINNHYLAEIAKHREAQAKCFAMKIKLQKILA